MKIYETSSGSVPKKAEEYSEAELYSLISSNRNVQDQEYRSIVMSEMKSQNLVSSAEEGMKLLKALTTFTIYDSLGEKKK